MNISRIKPALVLFVLVALLVCPSARNALAEKAIPDGFRFERTLRVGSQGDDARYLQILLNRDNETRVNAPGLIGGAGAETGYFGLATKNAVGKFQFKYASEVLAPAGLSKSTGVMATLAPSDLAPPPSFDEVNRKTREALVNVICTTKRGGSFNLISGSGVIIDPRGIILTNAHLGQYFLLQDFPTPGNIECIIRAGEPARNMYKATLLFIPPAWVRDNAAKIDADEPTGTGENDYALLLINDTTIEENPLPEIFQYIQMDFGDVSFREPAVVLIAAYPVGFLSGITVQKDLYPSSSVVVTGAVYSFKENTPDVFSLGGSVVAQKGSSGGAVVNRENKLIGLIVTSSTGKTTGERDLNALTMSHIDSSFREATGDSIRSLFVGDIRASAQSFNEKIAPELKKILQDALTKR
ncbi:MAG: hypothetical protein UY03_C0023G0017 [Parcubacteria group bacterium GW2011_GWA2_47_64]|nr:MAG: hypothetical protein UY03_C0023G0017 [Parcubacteria group bacterium GW2011_GWA2_47_64]